MSGMCTELPPHFGKIALTPAPRSVITGNPPASAPQLRLAPACVACFPPTLWTAGMGPTVRLAQWLPCRLAPLLHGSPASPARPHVPPSHSLHFSNQMAALICATVTGDAHWVRTAGSVSARPAGEGPDATLPWKPPALITRIMREVSKRLLIPIPSRTVLCVLAS